MKAGFQGERGAFAEQAARGALPGAETVPQKSFGELFDAVAAGAVDCAVVPIENTLAGSIIQNYDLLLAHDLTIVGEVVLPVVHNLIAAPGVSVDEIRRVYSQAPALAQCHRFLAALRGVEVVAAYDTAGSVKMVIEGGRRDEAAIASAAAAQAWGAAVLVPAIQDDARNYTRFFVLVRPDRAGSLSVSGAGRKTSIAFRIGNRPGALHRALAAFAEEGVDLTKLESRPIPGRPWEYSFYLDLLGGSADAPVQRALARLTAMAESLRMLGSYPTLEL